MTLCDKCGAALQIGDWPYCPHGRTNIAISCGTAHRSERAVVWENPATGDVRYPPTNDFAMPKLYRDAGFERRELPNVAAVHAMEKRTGTVNEKVSGSVFS